MLPGFGALWMRFVVWHDDVAIDARALERENEMAGQQPSVLVEQLVALPRLLCLALLLDLHRLETVFELTKTSRRRVGTRRAL
jgi:hypothetical protein